MLLKDPGPNCGYPLPTLYLIPSCTTPLLPTTHVTSFSSILSWTVIILGWGRTSWSKITGYFQCTLTPSFLVGTIVYFQMNYGLLLYLKLARFDVGNVSKKGKNVKGIITWSVFARWFLTELFEASDFDRINMTENQLEYDRKIITQRLQRRTWKFEHDRNTHENDQNFKVV